MATLGGGEGRTCMKLFNCISPKCRSILLTLLSLIVGFVVLFDTACW